MQSFIRVLITTCLLGGSLQSFASDLSIDEENLIKISESENKDTEIKTSEDQESSEALNEGIDVYKWLEYAQEKGSPILSGIWNSASYLYSGIKKRLPDAITDAVVYDAGLEAAVIYLVNPGTTMNDFLIMFTGAVARYGVRYMCFDTLESQGYENYKIACYLLGGPTGTSLKSALKGEAPSALSLFKSTLNNGMYGYFRNELNTSCFDQDNVSQNKCLFYYTLIEGTEGLVGSASNAASFRSIAAIKQAVIAHPIDLNEGIRAGLILYFFSEKYLAPQVSEPLKSGISGGFKVLEEAFMHHSGNKTEL